MSKSGDGRSSEVDNARFKRKTKKLCIARKMWRCKTASDRSSGRQSRAIGPPASTRPSDALSETAISLARGFSRNLRPERCIASTCDRIDDSVAGRDGLNGVLGASGGSLLCPTASSESQRTTRVVEDAR